MPYVALYAHLERIETDEGERVRLKNDTLYLCGGVAPSFEEAEEIARDCVRSAPEYRRAFILPRVFEFEEGKLIACGYEAQEKFEAILSDMNQAAEIIELAGSYSRR